MGNLIPEVESNLFGQAATNFESNPAVSVTIFTKTFLYEKSENGGIIMAHNDNMGDVPGAGRIIFVAISDIEGEPRWGAQYDALLPPQPARETIWKCLHSLGNNSKKSQK